MKWIKDRYKIIKKLTGGNLSKVFLSMDYGDDERKEVVIKAFDYADADNGDFHTKLFFREIENLEHLEHPGIVKLLDKGKDTENKIYYMAIEYFDSQTLDKVMFNDMLSDKQKFYILGQIIDSLVYAHSKQVIHRDLKPSNILINDSHEVKIIDFGTSKIKNSLYSEYTVSNYVTPKYASWEQKAFKTIDYRTDIYSLGLIMFELLTGTLIQEDSDLRSSIIEHESLEPELKNLLLKMTETQPDDRYSSMAEVRSVLKAVIKGKVQAPVYGISFANSAMAHLHKFGYIKNPTSRNEATQIIYKDITKSQTYMEYDLGTKGNQPAYKLYGKQLEYRCVVDNKTGSTFTITGIHSPNIFTLETKKERAVPVDGEWNVCPIIHDGSLFDDVNELIRQVEERKRELSIREKKEVEEKTALNGGIRCCGYFLRVWKNEEIP